MDNEISKRNSSLLTVNIQNSKDYIQYMITACKLRETKNVTNQRFKTAEEILISYKESHCYVGDRASRNRKITSCVQDLLNEHMAEEHRLDSDALHVLKRCRQNIVTFNTYNDVFNALSDYLWIIASIQKAVGTTTIHLLRRINLENSSVIVWIDGFYANAERAKYDLSCMQEAKKLPLINKIFLGTIRNADVAHYANSDNYSYDELNVKINGCEEFIIRTQFIYYAFLATNLYKNDIKWR